MNIEEKDAKRFQFLSALYEITQGDPFKIVNQWNLGASLGFSREETSQVCHFLRGEGLSSVRAIGGAIGITHDGVRKVEDTQRARPSPSNAGKEAEGEITITMKGASEVQEAIASPGQATEHFPPHVINYVTNFNGPVTNAQIQQASPGASQELHVVGDRVEDLRGLLAEMKAAIEKIGQEAKDNRDLEVQIATIEAQLIASKPKASIIKECLQSARTVFEGVAGNVIASGIVAKIATFMATL